MGSKDAVIAIAQGWLKFTRIEELNDPSELVPLMNRDAVRDSLVALRRNGYTDKQFRWLAHQEAMLNRLSPETKIISRPSTKQDAHRTLALPIYDDMEYMERQLLKTINLIRSRVGVLSLTERFDSLPMWAHYGAQAKGYVLRFDGLTGEFCGDGTGSLNALRPVRYVKDLVGVTHDPVTQENIFLCKFEDWSYEQEWRVISALSDCQMSDNGKMHRRRIDPRLVTGVICGWNIPTEEVSPLMSELGRINPKMEVLRTSLDRGRVVV